MKPWWITMYEVRQVLYIDLSSFFTAFTRAAVSSFLDNDNWRCHSLVPSSLLQEVVFTMRSFKGHDSSRRWRFQIPPTSTPPRPGNQGRSSGAPTTGCSGNIGLDSMSWCGMSGVHEKSQHIAISSQHLWIKGKLQKLLALLYIN